MVKGFKNASELDFTILSNKEAMLQAFAQVDKEKGQEYPLIIGGRRVTTEEKITSIAPATKEVLGKVSSCGKELADEAIRCAHEAFKTWSKVPAEERICCVRRLVELMDKERYILDAWSVEESGKNWGEADGELCEALDFFNSYIMHTRELDKGLELVDSEEATKCIYTPIGVGVAIPPWNFPLSLLAGMAIGAVITGNTVVCKPSSDTPIVAYKFVELCERAGFPAGVISFIPGSGSAIGDFIVQHPLTRFVNFTGSKVVGLRINKMAAEVSEGQKWIKRVVAEMGGKNAIIVDSSADLKRAASGIANSAFSFQGQKCSACSRAIVMSDVYDEFVEEIAACAEELKKEQGSGRDNLGMGPVINKAAFESITGYIEIARKEGNIVAGGKYDDTEGFYIEPTVVRDITRDARIANEEIFGPVLAVIKVESFDEALEIANDTEYGLTGSVYTEDRANIQKAKTEFHVGNLYFNRKSTGAVVLQHPFGGFNMSGTDAKTGTRDYLTNFLNLKSVCEDLTY
ncbi:L-glutamate gamma-semialdehyde dehydrogenase [Clostridium sp. C105KSO13]|uniref:L-glutamate gamma-semialdehyde dehydrogenase n=1 Tax=Clostridium sp. C105KSO13 TaxID=1776045 RepID=UPI0007407907|nr:L-glutamate gamma-semialdehyde dehydrogenase [Clostridium sp. C105KSO13]CUX37352.1 1-pyrroline-5-carboxylate dehydrogenase 1 [Clostridium sp. C105KSO13]